MNSLDQESISKATGKYVKQKKRTRFKDVLRVVQQIFRAIIFIVFLFFILFLVGFCFDKWLPNDDAKNIQGIWRVESTSGNIQITESQFILDKYTLYDYTLNYADKSIICVLNNYNGVCKYRFSKNNDTLLIVDGQISFFQSLFAELAWYFDRNIGCYFNEGQADMYIGYKINIDNNETVTLNRCQ